MGELLGEAVIGAHIAAAKIAGGHAMGYDDDVLCGNIVNCRRGLAGIQQSEAALAALRDRDVIPADLADSLVQQIQPARQLLEERIAELRSRVWW
jgi:hypothetical protein